MDSVTLEIEVACIVGILDRERVEPQALRIGLRLELDLEGTGETGDLGESSDYGEVDARVRFLAVHGQFRLIETLALALLRTVLAPPEATEGRGQIRRATVRITKPAVLRSAVAGVELTRAAAWAMRARTERPGGGTTETIVSVPDVLVERHTLPVGAEVRDAALYGIAGVHGPVAVPFRAECPCVVLAVRRTA